MDEVSRNNSNAYPWIDCSSAATKVTAWPRRKRWRKLRRVRRSYEKQRSSRTNRRSMSSDVAWRIIPVPDGDTVLVSCPARLLPLPAEVANRQTFDDQNPARENARTPSRFAMANVASPFVARLA